jgi:hypothetical protein
MRLKMVFQQISGKPATYRRSRLLCSIYATFFATLIFAQRARTAAAIFLRAPSDIVRLAGAEMDVFPTDTGSDFFRRFAHRAFCANPIFRREDNDIIRFGWTVLAGTESWDTPVPFKDSIPEMI